MRRATVIIRWSDLTALEQETADIDAVFFAASNTQDFADAEDRREFRELWLGQYLAKYPKLAHVSLGSAGQCLGYCVVWPDDPRTSGVFGDLDYFSYVDDALARFPAHLHINLAETAQGNGLGSSLLSVTMRALSRECPGTGVHIFTEATARNRGFYVRNGFDEVATVLWRDRRLVMMGRMLV